MGSPYDLNEIARIRKLTQEEKNTLEIRKLKGEVASLALMVEIMGKHLAKMIMESKAK